MEPAAYFFAGEHLDVIPLAGVALLAFGLMSLALSSGTLTRTELPAIAVAALTGLTIASYTVVDGLGVRAAHNPYAYAGLMFALLGPVFPLVVLFRRPVARCFVERLQRFGIPQTNLVAIAGNNERRAIRAKMGEISLELLHALLRGDVPYQGVRTNEEGGSRNELAIR